MTIACGRNRNATALPGLSVLVVTNPSMPTALPGRVRALETLTVPFACTRTTWSVPRVPSTSVSGVVPVIPFVPISPTSTCGYPRVYHPPDPDPGPFGSGPSQ
jgi:hypothetical protein